MSQSPKFPDWTPGEWKPDRRYFGVESKGRGATYVARIMAHAPGEAPRAVCTFGTYQNSVLPWSPEGEANATLIAGAPRLMIAARKALNVLDAMAERPMNVPQRVRDVLEELRLAIDLAERKGSPS